MNMKDSEKIRRKQLINKRIFNSSVMIIGLALILLFTSYMQRRYSELKYIKASQNAMDTIVRTMDENTEKVNLLIERYHKDNQAIVDDFVTLFKTGRYHLLYSANSEKRCEVMGVLSKAIEDKGYLFVIDGQGNVILTPFSEYENMNLLEENIFTASDFEFLKSEKNSDDVSYVIGNIKDTNEQGYFYCRALNDHYYLVYGLECSELDEQYAALRKLGPILSNAVIGETGFVFALDSDTGKFKYFDNGEVELTGANAKEHGVSDELFADEYSGIQTIENVEYNVLSQRHSSTLYGDFTIVVAACTTSEVYASNPTTNAIISIVFILTTAICLFYAFTLQTDPDQLVYYDENVMTTKQARKSNLFDPEVKKSFKNIKVFKYIEDQIYFKAGVATNLAPIIILSLVVIFVVSYNTQTMVELSKGLTESNGAVKQTEKIFENSESSSQLLMEHYQSQYLSKIKILSYMIEEQPSLVFNSDNGYGQNVNSLHKYIDADYDVVYKADGSVLTSISKSQPLEQLAKQNGFDSLYIYDDHGHTIATNSDLWYFVLSSDPDSQSYEFTKLISGEISELIQKPQLDDSGEYKQYVGVSFYYYTFYGDGRENGNYASEDDYFRYVEDGSINIDGVDYRVISHIGVVQGSISDKTIEAIMDSTKPETLLSNINVDSNGFLVLFDNSEEHVCLWSPRASSVGKTAEQLGLSKNSFSGIHKGLSTINGEEFFQNFFYRNGYWVATAIPTTDLFTGRVPISLIILAISACFFLFMFVSCVFTSDTEEQDFVLIAERRILSSEDSGMVKVTMKDGREKYARTTTSRFSSSSQKWVNMLPYQKLERAFKFILAMVVIASLAGLLFPEKVFGADSLMYYIIHGDWEHSFNYFAYVSFAGMLIIVYAAASVISWIISAIITNLGNRIETIGRLVLSVLKYGSVLFSIFYGLSLLGVSTASLVTSASIMSIVIGLGSQSLISDILAGIFIVFEGSFRVGDIVTVDNFRGTVIDIGLRTTKIENNVGNTMIFNNSSIKSILNMTKRASVIKVNLNISYKEDLAKVEDILRDCCDDIDRKLPGLLNEPSYYGVTELGKDFITLTVIGSCAEQDKEELTMELTRELYLVLKENNVSCQYNKI